MNELYEFTVRDRTFRFSSGLEDITVPGRGTFTAGKDIQISRSAIRIQGADSGDATVTVNMSRYHEMVLLINRFSLLPDLTILRPDGTVLFSGRVNQPPTLTSRGRSGIARFEVVSVFQHELAGTHQNMLYQQRCNWALYDSSTCRVSRSQFSVTTTVLSISALGITVNPNGVPALRGASTPFGYFQGGSALRVLDGARRKIVSHSRTVIGFATPFIELAVGDGITLSAGCNHSIRDCRDKFDNLSRFGGQPAIPERSPAAINLGREDAAR